MAWLSTVRELSIALGVWKPHILPIGCTIGKTAYREARRATTIANVFRPRRRLHPKTSAMLARLFPDLDVARIRYKARSRLPPNRFADDGWVAAMTFGYTLYFRDKLDESKAKDLALLVHEVVHVDQVRRHGSEDEFACAYGEGYLTGKGDLPGHIRNPSKYHRNPLEAEAYRFQARFQDANGAPQLDSFPWGT
jgi:hypothetical protein